MNRGLLAEFKDPQTLISALRELQAQGYRAIDAYTPYPLREAEDALELPRSLLPFMMLPFAIFGVVGAYWVQWWTNARDYPINVGGRPLHSALALVPITFEMGVLVSSVGGIGLLLWLMRLPELYHPIFEVEAFRSASRDRFWIGIDEADPRFDRDQVTSLLVSLNAVAIHPVGGVPS